MPLSATEFGSPKWNTKRTRVSFVRSDPQLAYNEGGATDNIRFIIRPINAGAAHTSLYDFLSRLTGLHKQKRWAWRGEANRYR